MSDTEGQLWYPQGSEPAPLLYLNHVRLRHGGQRITEIYLLNYTLSLKIESGQWIQLFNSESLASATHNAIITAI